MNRAIPRRPPFSRVPAPGPSEPEAVQRFRKVLELELKRGGDDSAVIGGLDRFLARARQDKDVGRLLSAAPPIPDGYAALGPEARQRWVRTILAAKPAAVRRAAPGSHATTPSDKAEQASAPPRTTASRGGTTGTALTTPAGAPATTRPAPPAERLEQPVTAVKGIKGGLQARLAKLGVQTVRDLIYLFPNRHSDFGDVRLIADLGVGEDQTCIVTVWSASIVRLGRMHGTQAIVGDGSGTMRVTWFNNSWIAEQLRTNERIFLSGKVGQFNGQRTMENPEWERVDKGAADLTHTGRLVPVYPLTAGLSQRVLRRAVKEAADSFAAFVTEPLPSDLRRRHNLPGVVEALRHMHYPDSRDQYEQAKQRMAFEELLCVQLAVLERRAAWQEGRAPVFAVGGALGPARDDVLAVYRSSLPFALTGAQERVLDEVVADLGRPRPMARLLQGDVGSGKTAVAGAALAIAAANGYQGALMAPTEILAEQHYRTLTSLLGGIDLPGRAHMRVELLTGSLRSREKREVLEAIAAGDVDVAVGTHALIQDSIGFQRLGLTVVDEQHRFGVMQRAALRERAMTSGGETPHLLVMSATPIPRTLALTLFGDLDVSVIDEMPPGRLPVETHSAGPEDRGAVFDFVREKVEEGRQAFVVYPLIDESDKVAARAATQEYERLATEVFPELKVGLLHGRMAAIEKEAVLGAFRDHRLDVLVATTVVEVGIDVPNATVMVIEGADRFGLAQLHQLRGRVGRGVEQSFCLLLSEDPSFTARQRLEVLERTNDGFELAEADLRIRGPGDYLGTRQSGIPELMQVADFSNVRLVETARQEAQDLLEADPGLQSPEHTELAKAVARTKRVVSGDAS